MSETDYDVNPRQGYVLVITMDFEAGVGGRGSATRTPFFYITTRGRGTDRKCSNKINAQREILLS